MSVYRWGIIGPGNIALKFADALARSEQGVLAAVASRSAQRAREFAATYQVDKIYTDYAQLVNDVDIDIVYIATPHSHHYEQALLCLNAGKHVLLEKPLTINALQTEKLCALASQKGVLLQEALWSRFMPCFAQVKQWLAEGEIGHLEYIQSDIGFAFSDDPQNRINNPDLAGGALLDLGIYSISLSQFIVGQDPQHIQAVCHKTELGVDQTTLVNLTYPNGQLSQFTCATRAKCSNSMTLVGDRGRIFLPEYFWVGEAAQLWRDGQLIECLDFSHQVNGFEYQIAEAMRCVSAGEICSPLMSHADSIKVMQSMDEVRRQIGLQYSDSLENS